MSIYTVTRGDLADLVQTWGSTIDIDVFADQPTEQRWYFRLHANAEYDVWLLGWHHEQSTDFHDHGGSAGAFTVLSGALIEERFERETGVKSIRLLESDDTSTFDYEAIHNVNNAGFGRSMSVHAYSPPLNAMTYYNIDSHTPTVTETIAVDRPEPDAIELVLP